MEYYIHHCKNGRKQGMHYRQVPTRHTLHSRNCNQPDNHLHDCTQELYCCATALCYSGQLNLTVFDTLDCTTVGDHCLFALHTTTASSPIFLHAILLHYHPIHAVSFECAVIFAITDPTLSFNTAQNYGFHGVLAYQMIRKLALCTVSHYYNNRSTRDSHIASRTRQLRKWI